LVNIKKFLAFNKSFVASFYASSVVNAMKIPLVCQKKKTATKGRLLLALGNYVHWPDGNHFGCGMVKRGANHVNQLPV